MNINFTGKFILYGQKETVDKTKEKMKSKCERFDSFDINLSKGKISFTTTGKDCSTIKGIEARDYKDKIYSIIKGDKKSVFQNLSNLIFGTAKNVPILQQSTMENFLRHKKCYEDIEFNNGTNPLLKNKRHIVRYVDGSSRIFSAKGNEVEQQLKDGTIIQESSNGSKKYTYPTGIIEHFNYNNRLLSRKYPNGSEEFFDKINSRIKTRILPDGKVIKFYYQGDKIHGVIDENQNQGRVCANGEIIWTKHQTTQENLLNETGEKGYRTKITRSGIIQKCFGKQLIEEHFPDGRIKKYNKKGITEIHPDGTIIYYDRLGRQL